MSTETSSHPPIETGVVRDDELRALVADHVAPRAAQIDAEAEYPSDVHARFAEAGLFAAVVATTAESGAARSSAIIATVARTCGGCALMLMIQRLGSLPVALAGTDRQRRDLLPRLSTGEWTPAFALTEAEAGSDPSGMRTRATRFADGWRINGSKTWISNAPVADVVVVFAVTDPDAGTRGVTAFLVPAATPGLEATPVQTKVGVRAIPTSGIALKDVRVSEQAVIGVEGEGLKLALRTLAQSRLGVAAQAIGLGRGALEAAATHARTRTQFGRPLLGHQAVAHPLADQLAHLHAADALLVRACRAADDGDADAGSLAAMAKLVASERAVSATQTAVQILGAEGYRQGSIVERLARDARVTTIYEGTSEIQRELIARAQLA